VASSYHLKPGNADISKERLGIQAEIMIMKMSALIAQGFNTVLALFALSLFPSARCCIKQKHPPWTWPIIFAFRKRHSSSPERGYQLPAAFPIFAAREESGVAANPSITTIS
jgi:hypothetical protein